MPRRPLALLALASSLLLGAGVVSAQGPEMAHRVDNPWGRFMGAYQPGSNAMPYRSDRIGVTQPEPVQLPTRIGGFVGGPIYVTQPPAPTVVVQQAPAPAPVIVVVDGDSVSVSDGSAPERIVERRRRDEPPTRPAPRLVPAGSPSRGALGRVEISVRPADSRVYLDDRRLVDVGLLELPAGVYRLEIEHGTLPGQRTLFAVPADGAVRVDVDLWESEPRRRALVTSPGR